METPPTALHRQVYLDFTNNTMTSVHLLPSSSHRPALPVKPRQWMAGIKVLPASAQMAVVPEFRRVESQLSRTD